MKLTFYGAARTVTGSKHLLEVNGQRILLDCGLFQGKRSESYQNNVHLPFDAAGVDLCVLSHAHIDHCGNLPNLVKSGFRGDIISTPATRDLCATMLPDSGHIQERDVEFVNKKKKKRGEPLVEPIYTQEDAFESIRYFSTQNYHRQRMIAPGVYLTYKDAGHMLGSAIVILDIEDRDQKRDVRLVFSGDIGRKGIPIIRDPETVDRADILIMESTYGDRLHETFGASEDKLQEIVNRTYKRGGTIVMPSFAVGRTQQLVYTLHQLMDRRDIPEMPIFVDSPLAVNTTAVFSLHPECFDSEMREFMLQPGNSDPFGFEHITYVRTLEESKQLNFEKRSVVIISASGMMEFGRILHHLKHRIEDSRNTILITGWQAPNTLGRRMVDGDPQVKIFGELYDNNAETAVLNGFSGHADRDELLAWLGAIDQKPQRVFLVHGEESAAFGLQASIQERFKIQTDVPEPQQMFEI
ncbi:MAG: MBL fold metallo-hydrolase [Anaerolineae bacterium]|jgi:metallo-beta-lactamase family protein|nr:MBL fold metallo-hydrolase [Anaerolineae bacterium]